MKRKDFLKTMAAAGAAVATQGMGGVDALAQAEKTGNPDLVAVVGGEPDVMFQKAIAEFGGMGRFVKKGQKVTIKPNIGWDKAPELAANTNPILVKEMVKQALEAGASEVVVFDHTCDDWRKCYPNSGIEKAVIDAGGKMLPADNERYYREVEFPAGKMLTKGLVHTAILDCDVWFNVPVLKTHGGARMTISLKNLMGIVWDRRVFHGPNLQQFIADSCTLVKRPALNVVDAYRVLKANGPRGRSEADAVLTKGLFASPDIVAVDTAAVAFFNQVAKMPIDEVEHIAFAQDLKLGTMDLDKLNIKRIRA